MVTREKENVRHFENKKLGLFIYYVYFSATDCEPSELQGAKDNINKPNAAYFSAAENTSAKIVRRQSYGAVPKRRTWLVT